MLHSQRPSFLSSRKSEKAGLVNLRFGGQGQHNKPAVVFLEKGGAEPTDNKVN
jgi:hypothetical protein